MSFRAEQTRIVAKVDELMALCDELEAKLAHRDTRRERLHAATIHDVLRPAETLAPEPAQA